MNMLDRIVLLSWLLGATTSPPITPQVDRVWLNPDLVSRFYLTSTSLVAATSGGLLFLDPHTLAEIQRIPWNSGNELPYPVVVDLQGLGDTLWLALWKHGVAVVVPSEGDNVVATYVSNPQYFPAMERVKHLALRDSFLVQLTDTLLSVWHLQGTAHPQDDQLRFYRFAGAPPFTSVAHFLSVTASPDSLFVGTDHGLYAVAWPLLDIPEAWHLRMEGYQVAALAWHSGQLAVGTDQGLHYNGQVYAPGQWIGMVTFTGDTLYADPKDSTGAPPLRIWPDGNWETVTLPENAGTDVRDVVTVGERVVYGLGYSDRPDPEWERYNLGRALVIEQDGQRAWQDLQGPSLNRIVSLDWHEGTLWVVGSQPHRPYSYPVSLWRQGEWQVGNRLWVPVPRHIVAFSGGALVTCWNSQGGLYVFDTLAQWIQQITPPDPVVTAVLPLSDTTGVVASYNGDLHLYNLRQGSLEYLGNVGGGGDAFPYTLFEDHLGRLWVGRVLGFTVYEALDRLDHFLFADEGRVPTTVTAMDEDSEGRIWLGTLSGVYVVQGQNVQRVGTLPPLSVYDLKVLPTYLLVLTETGLAVYTAHWPPELVVEVTRETGLPDVPRPEPLDNLYLYAPRHALALDPDGYVYVATNKGVARVRLEAAGTPSEVPAIRVYPNPLDQGQDQFWVVGTSPLRWIGLFRLTGQRVSGVRAEEETPGTLTIRGASSLEPGVYVGVVQTGEGETHTFRMAVVK